MNPELTSQELYRLFMAKADGTITPEEHERLSALLKDSAKMRREWFAFQDAEAGLLAWSQRENARQEVGIGPGMSSSEPSPRGFLKYAGALAAGIVIGLVAWALWPKPAAQVTPNLAREEATTSSVAVLSRGVNMEWDRTVATPSR